MNPELQHLLTLARSGNHSRASSAERQARKIVRAVIDNAIGLDAQATQGIDELIGIVQANPMAGTKAVREFTGIRS